MLDPQRSGQNNLRRLSSFFHQGWKANFILMSYLIKNKVELFYVCVYNNDSSVVCLTKGP